MWENKPLAPSAERTEQTASLPAHAKPESKTPVTLTPDGLADIYSERHLKHRVYIITNDIRIARGKERADLYALRTIYDAAIVEIHRRKALGIYVKPGRC